MLENQQLVVMLCKLQCICCVKTFVFGILFSIFLAVGGPPLDLGVSYKFHTTALCQHCVQNKIRNMTLLFHIYLITAWNKIQCPVIVRLHGDVFFPCQVGKCFIFVGESVSTSVPVFTVGHVFKPVWYGQHWYVSNFVVILVGIWQDR